MNFLAHIYLSGDNKNIRFGNFIGDFVKGKKYIKKYSEDITEGITLHREIDSFTDAHPVVRRSIERIRPAYGKYSGVVTDILYDHFLAKNWNNYSSENLENYIADFHYDVLERIDLLPRKARRFVFPFIRKKRLLCYADLSCFGDVLKKMAIFTSMPDRVIKVTEIINENYDDFYSDFVLFFPEVKQFSENFISEYAKRQSKTAGQTDKQHKL